MSTEEKAAADGNLLPPAELGGFASSYIPTSGRQPTRSATLAKLSLALSKAQGQMSGAKKDADNPFFHSRYADLASVWEALRAPLAANELAAIQLPEWDGAKVSLETILSHSSGEWISSRLDVIPGYTDKQGNFITLSDAQAIGSAITYARRYALSAMTGIAPEEDDGNAASGQGMPDKKGKQEEEGTVTDEPVPAKYWDMKNKDGPEAANKYLSGVFDGAKVGTRKTDHGWKVVIYGDVPAGVLMPREAATAETEAKREATARGWEHTVCHIGKANGPIKGKPLGQLTDDQRDWLLETIREKGDRAGTSDKRLLASLMLWKSGAAKLPEQHASNTAAGAEGVNRQILRDNLEWAGIRDAGLFLQVVTDGGYTQAGKTEDITDSEAAKMVANFPAIEALYVAAFEKRGNDELPGLEGTGDTLPK